MFLILCRRRKHFNFQANGLNYMFDLNCSEKPKRIIVELPAGTCKDDQNISNSFGSVVIFYGDIVTKAEDLVGWWKFDEANGTEVPDSAGTGVNAMLQGDAVLDTDSVLGTKSLKLDGDGDAAKVYGLKRSTPANAYRFEDLQLCILRRKSSICHQRQKCNCQKPTRMKKVGMGRRRPEHLEASNPPTGITEPPRPFPCGLKPLIKLANLPTGDMK